MTLSFMGTKGHYNNRYGPNAENFFYFFLRLPERWDDSLKRSLRILHINYVSDQIFGLGLKF